MGKRKRTGFRRGGVTAVNLKDAVRTAESVLSESADGKKGVGGGVHLGSAAGGGKKKSNSKVVKGKGKCLPSTAHLSTVHADHTLLPCGLHQTSCHIFNAYHAWYSPSLSFSFSLPSPTKKGGKHANTMLIRAHHTVKQQLATAREEGNHGRVKELEKTVDALGGFDMCVPPLASVPLTHTHPSLSQLLA